ncbi:hypothetical protein GCM10010193_25500 [Kitasatospora atroaurantiaca]
MVGFGAGGRRGLCGAIGGRVQGEEDEIVDDGRTDEPDHDEERLLVQHAGAGLPGEGEGGGEGEQVQRAGTVPASEAFTVTS